MQHATGRTLNRFSIATDNQAPGSAPAVCDPDAGSESTPGAAQVQGNGRVRLRLLYTWPRSRYAAIRSVLPGVPCTIHALPASLRYCSCASVARTMPMKAERNRTGRSPRTRTPRRGVSVANGPRSTAWMISQSGWPGGPCRRRSMFFRVNTG